MRGALTIIVSLLFGWTVQAQTETPVFKIDRLSICIDRKYIKTYDSATAAYTLRTIGQVNIGDIVYTVRTAKFSGWDNEPGFNVIEISNGDRVVFLHMQTDGLITFDEGLYGPTLQRFSDNNHFITSQLSDKTAVLIFVGWSYDNTPSQLLIIALTPQEVKTVYNEQANIVSIKKNSFSMDIQTYISDFDESRPTCTIYEKSGVLWIRPYKP